MDIKKYVKLNDKGELEFDEDGFQSGLDSEISRAVDKYAKGKGRDEIRKQLEEEAKLTAEQKLQAEKEKFEKYKQEETVKLIQAKAEAKLNGKGFTEKEIKFILSKIGNDEQSDMSSIDELIAERTEFITTTQKNAIQKLQQQQQNSGSGQSLSNPDNSSNQEQKPRSRDEILSFYRKQN